MLLHMCVCILNSVAARYFASKDSFDSVNHAACFEWVFLGYHMIIPFPAVARYRRSTA